VRPDKGAILAASLCAVALGLVPSLALAFPGQITAFAGTGSAGGGGDGGPATEARLRDPVGLAFDADGNLYIADRGNHRIRRVDAGDGDIETVAGSGARGDSGDGGEATEAELDSPEGIAVDDDGNLYVADTQNHRIRRVDADTGVITTIAGDGTEGDSGDGGPAIGAQLAEPRGVAVDALGRVFIADTVNHRLRRVDLSGNISTIAGTGDSGYSGDNGPATSAKIRNPGSLAFDTGGDLFFADTENDRIRKVELPSGTIRTVAGNGTSGFGGDGSGALGAKVKKPAGIALDADRNLYVADTENHRIRRVEHGTGIITTIAGTGLAGDNGDGGAALAAHLRQPAGVVAAANGDVLFADTENHRVRRIENPPFPACGNGLVEAGEDCDGGAAPNDCCSATCTLESAGTTCRAAAGPCDLAETCSGAVSTCPADAVKTSGTACQAGGCAVASTCDGVAVSCPVGGFLPPSTVCRGIAGDCDVAENCTGSSAACPSDVVSTAGTTCRTAAGDCDVAESCDGSAPSCPTNAFAGTGTVCRAAGDDCDAVETCSGSSAACPGDALSPAGTVCRGAAGACDLTETCSGGSPACPSDVLVSAGVECRPEGDSCDPAEECSGSAAACPGDFQLPDGSSCDDGDPETTDDRCFGGSCGCAGGDLDDDGLPDTCDPEEAPVVVLDLVLRTSPIVRGRATAKGRFPIEELGAGDVLDATNGLDVRVLGAADEVVVAVSFAPGECIQGTKGWRCKKPDKSSTARFKRRLADDDSAYMTFSFKLGALDLPGPLAPPVRVALTAAWIDRVGAPATCEVVSSGLRCE